MSGPDDEHKPAPSGRVRHDSGGRAIWEWAIDSGRHAVDSTSRLLKKLDVSSLRLMGDDEKAWEKKAAAESVDSSARRAAPDLSMDQETARAPAASPGIPNLRLEDDVEPKTPTAKKAAPAPVTKAQGFDPYDSRMPVRKVAPAKRAAPPAPPPKKGLLSRLFGR